MTPEEFEKRVMKIYGIASTTEFKQNWGDENRRFEEHHLCIDELLWDLLDSLGYKAGIDIIRKAPAWYE